MTANLRFGAGYVTPRPDTVLRLRRVRRLRRRRRDVQRRRRLPQDARGHDVPVVHGDARRAAHDARPRQRAAARHGRPPRRSRARTTTASTRRSTCASSAARARPSARSASTWRASRASSSPATGSATARRLEARALGNARSLARLGSALAPLSNCGRTQRRRAGAGRASPRHRPAPPPAGVPAPHARAPRAPRGGTAPAAAAALRRHLHQLLRPGDRRRRARRARGRGRAARRSPATAAAGGRRSRRGCSTTPARWPRRNAERLYDDAAAGRPLVFCEPSCLSAVREDAPALLRGEARRKAQVVAGASVLFEEYVGRAWRAAAARGRARRACCSTGTATSSRWGSCRPPRRCCRAIPGVTVVDAEAGCCGMAGSFGYGRDHYDVSKAIGERRLFPAVRDRAARARWSSPPAPRAAIRFTISPTSRPCTRRCCCARCSPKGPAHEPGLAVARRARRRDDRELHLRAERRRPRAGAGVARRRLRRRPRRSTRCSAAFRCSSFSRWPASRCSSRRRS